MILLQFCYSFCHIPGTNAVDTVVPIPAVVAGELVTGITMIGTPPVTGMITTGTEIAFTGCEALTASVTHTHMASVCDDYDVHYFCYRDPQSA